MIGNGVSGLGCKTRQSIIEPKEDVDTASAKPDYSIVRER